MDRKLAKGSKGLAEGLHYTEVLQGVVYTPRFYGSMLNSNLLRYRWLPGVK